jgi:hypothetical protein
MNCTNCTFQVICKLDAEKRTTCKLGEIKPASDCFGMTWDELEKKQGGKLNRRIK